MKATEVTTTLPAKTPVLINASEGSYSFVPTTATAGSYNITDKSVSGALTGVYTTTNVPASSYILWANAENPIGFYKANNSTVDAYHAYLTADGVGARSLTIVYGDDDTQGISAIDNSQSAIGKYYDLQGRRVSQPTKGLYIVNGKKVAIK